MSVGIASAVSLPRNDSKAGSFQAKNMIAGFNRREFLPALVCSSRIVINSSVNALSMLLTFNNIGYKV